MTKPHPFSEWNVTPRYERGKLARAAMSQHPTTGDLLLAYFDHDLHETQEGMKTPEEIRRDLQDVVSVQQIRRYVKTHRPNLFKQLGEPR